MAIIQLENLNWPAVDALDRQRTLLLQPVSPIEEHGPHLPLGVDLWVAEYFARRLAERWAEEHEDWTIAVLPSLALGSNAFAAPGTVCVRQSAMRDVIYDTGACWAQAGFRYLFLASGHGSTGHLVALEEAAHAIERGYGMKMVSLSSKLIPEVLSGALWNRVGERLGRELSATERAMLRGDTHAGLLETSLMLKLRPELVDDSYRQLEPYDPPMIEKLRDSYATREGRLGYVGYPAAASAEFGEAALEAFVDVAYERMIEAMCNPDVEKLSVLARVPPLRVGWRRMAGAISLAAASAFGAGLLAFLVGRRQRDKADPNDIIPE